MKRYFKYLGVAVGAAVVQAVASQLAAGHVDVGSLITVALIAAGAYAKTPPVQG